MPTANQTKDAPIGFLVSFPGEKGYRVACAECTASRASPVYHVNVYPYRQTCCDCGRVLVQGAPCGKADCDGTDARGLTDAAPGHTHWCELFDGGGKTTDTCTDCGKDRSTMTPEVRTFHPGAC